LGCLQRHGNISPGRRSVEQGNAMITGRAQDFIELIEALKNLGNNGHFELLLFTKLNEIDRPFADITVGELIEAAKTVNGSGS
jgi:hypothetical protein